MVRIARHFILAVILILLPSLALAETPVERITRTKTLQCGYIPYEPYIIKDPNTGDLSGIVIEYVSTVAGNKGLKVEWTEVNIDQAPTAVGSGRIDAYCIPASPDKHWLEALDVSAPFGALPYYVYVPQDSKMGMTDLKKARFVVVDGFALTTITQEVFPDAVLQSLSQITSPAEMYDQLRYGKADAHINENVSATNYMKNNPDTIKRLSGKPAMVMRMFMSSKKGDEVMKSFMEKTFGAGLPDNEKILDGLLTKYHVSEGSYWLERECIQKAANDRGWLLCETKK